MIPINEPKMICWQDECSFVSLRDVERAMIVFKYFYEKMSDFQQAAKEKQLVLIPDEV